MRYERKSGPGAFGLHQELTTNQQKTLRRRVFRELIESSALEGQNINRNIGRGGRPMVYSRAGGGLIDKLEFSYNAALKKKQQI